MPGVIILTMLVALGFEKQAVFAANLREYRIYRLCMATTVGIGLIAAMAVLQFQELDVQNDFKNR